MHAMWFIRGILGDVMGSNTQSEVKSVSRKSEKVNWTFPIYFFPVLLLTDEQGLSCPWNFEGIFYKKYLVLVDVNEI